MDYLSTTLLGYFLVSHIGFLGLYKSISHHHFVVRLVLRFLKDSSEYLQVGVNGRIVNCDVEVIVSGMGAVIYP